MDKKTIWIRLGANTEKEEAMEWLLHLAEEGLAGEMPVVLIKGTDRTMLSHVYDVDDKAWIAIVEKFGERNVRIQETKKRGMMEPGEASAYHLERIADSLEEIAGCLQDLSDCVFMRDGKSFLLTADASRAR